MASISREDALALLKKYNQDPFHIQHGLTVEAVMRWYARELGFEDEEEYWGSSAFCTTLISKNIRSSTVSKRRKFCAMQVFQKT